MNQSKYVIIRIISNDLPPRHGKGQSLKNLRFILENEPEFENCTKFWIINKIFNPEMEQNIVALLEEKGQTYLNITFDLNDYDPKWHNCQKNLYLIGINSVRNIAIEQGKKLGGEWIFPFDGNIFVPQVAFDQLKKKLEYKSKEINKIFQIKMYRLQDNKNIDTIPSKIKWEEPQIVIHRDCSLKFNEILEWGDKDKYSLLSKIFDPALEHVVRLADFTIDGHVLDVRKKNRKIALKKLYLQINIM